MLSQIFGTFGEFIKTKPIEYVIFFGVKINSGPMCTATIVNTSWSMCDNDRGGIEGGKGEGVIKLEGVLFLVDVTSNQ